MLLRPGFLSIEYFAGRRARYIQPLRLYIITSIVFFLTLSVATFFSSNQQASSQQANKTEAQTQESQEDENTKEIEDQVIFSFDSDDSEEDKRAKSKAREVLKNLREEIPEAKDDFNILDIPFVSPEHEEKIKHRLKEQTKKAIKIFEEDRGDIARMAIELAPPVMFCLLPIFALLLKILYIYKGKYYTEHLVLAVHNHCFVYAMLTCSIILSALLDSFVGDWPTDILMIWLPVYLFMSLSRVYQQNWFLTFLNFGILSISYAALLGIGMGIAAMFGLLTL